MCLYSQTVTERRSTIMRIHSHSCFSQPILKDARDCIIALVLQMLTHRCQYGDERLFLLFVKLRVSSLDYADSAIMSLSAELKEVIFIGGSRIKTAPTTFTGSKQSFGMGRQRTNCVIVDG